MKNNIFKIGKILGVAAWLLLIILCLLNRDKITVESIINYSPENLLAAAFIMLGCFAFKSITLFIYSGILYAASGIIFPLPAALAVNMLGAFIMASLPYFIGRFAGNSLLQQLTEKHPKLSAISDLPRKNELVTPMTVRAVLRLPCDLVSLYFGARNFSYIKYVTGSMLGFIPSIIIFTVIGTSAKDPTSPAFIISVAIELLFITGSLIALLAKRKHSKA